MKKTTFYIITGILVAITTAIIVIEYRRRKGILQPTTGTDYIPVSDSNSYTTQTFAGFNYNLLLNDNTVHGEAEISALQALINGYYAGATTIPVSGTWDAATAAAVQHITGKSSTNLYEFRYFYFDPQRGDDAAKAIFKSMTNG